jgi:hypothetical protein
MLSLETLEDSGFLVDAVIGVRIESRFDFLVGLASGLEGNPEVFLGNALGLGGGKLATLFPPLGGCGNEEVDIDTARFGSIGEVGDIIDDGRPKLPDSDRPGLFVGKREVRRNVLIEGFVLSEVGSAGSADVGGFDALNERDCRGIVVVVVVAIVCVSYDLRSGDVEG